MHGLMKVSKNCISMDKRKPPDKRVFKAPITTAADDKFCDIFPYFGKNKV